MMPFVIGMQLDVAQKMLVDAGYGVLCIAYESKRKIPNADSTRVIRARPKGNNTVEITVSYFKTQL